MAQWGIAVAGPYYNRGWQTFAPQEKEEALATAHAALEAAQVQPVCPLDN